MGKCSGKLSAASLKQERKRVVPHVANGHAAARPASVGAQLAGDGDFKDAIAGKPCAYTSGAV